VRGLPSAIFRFAIFLNYVAMFLYETCMNRDRTREHSCHIDFEILRVMCQDNLKRYLELVAVMKMQLRWLVPSV
jgi:hypothetical protein